MSLGAFCVPRTGRNRTLNYGADSRTHTRRTTPHRGGRARSGAGGRFEQGVTSIDIPTTADWQTGVQTEVKAYRSGNVVTVSAWRLAVNSGVTGDVIAYSLPTGYRTPPLTNIYGLKDSRGATVNASSDTVRVLNPSGSVAHHSFTFVTLDPPPTA